jgi:hypothetical protein
LEPGVDGGCLSRPSDRRVFIGRPAAVLGEKMRAAGGSGPLKEGRGLCLYPVWAPANALRIRRRPECASASN